ncbi:MAG: helix-turn-helix domain-containing protein, partial [Nanoarchaeota archaeon]
MDRAKKEKDARLFAIRRALKKSDGLWVREIARRCGMDKSTCSRCLLAMENGSEVEFEMLGCN